MLRLFVRRGLFEREDAEAMLAWPHSGFHVHDAVLVPDGDVAFALRLARVTAHIPNKHQVMTRYYGYYANRVRGARHQRAGVADTPITVAADPVPLPLREARRRWAELLRQIFEVDPLRCPQCGADMRIVAFITARAVIDRILDHLRRTRDTARGPPRRPPGLARRAPPRPARQPH